VTTLRVTSWDELTLINRILQIRFIAFWFIESLMQQIFNLLINMIIIESSSTNSISEVFHFVENDNRIDFETNALFENELNLVTANRIFINKFVNHLLVQWDNSDYENYVLWTILHDEFENWIVIQFDQLTFKIWNDLRIFCYTHDVWIEHNFEFDRIKISIMLKIIRFDWNNIWTFEQIKWIENHYESLSRVIKKRKHEINDTSNLDDTTTYFFESIVESNRYIRHVILDDRHIRFSTSEDQHEMYSTLSVQSLYAYSVVRAQLEYSYHSDFSFSQFSSSAVIVSIRASESATINQSIRIENQHARFVFLSASVSNQHARSASSFVISASVFRNSTSIDENYYESTQSRFVQNFFKELSQLDKIYKNDEKFKNTDDNFEFKLKSSSISVNVSSYHRMHTWKKSHSCLRIERYLNFMSMSMRTSHSTNSVSIWRNSSKNLNENDLIWRNDNSFTLTMSLSRIRICRWSNVFRNYVLIWMTFKKNWTLIITTRIICEKF
jgi:hypothetical protein